MFWYAKTKIFNELLKVADMLAPRPIVEFHVMYWMVVEHLKCTVPKAPLSYVDSLAKHNKFVQCSSFVSCFRR